MKELGQNKEEIKKRVDEDNVPKWKQKLKEERDANPLAKECYERLVEQAHRPQPSEDEIREFYEQLLYDRQHEGGVHADWAYIMKWLKEHPRAKSDV